MEKTKGKIYFMAIAALFASLITAGTFIRIPFPVIPMTLQTLFVILPAMLLGSRLAITASGIYILSGLVGLPVFTAGGGPLYVLHPTFGYLLGFLFAAVITGMLSQRDPSASVIKLFFYGIAGICSIYFAGIAYMAFLSSIYGENSFSFTAILSVGYALTIAGDVLKCVAAAMITVKMRKILPKSGLYSMVIRR
jgi:biotin transport system substrate-specific component